MRFLIDQKRTTGEPQNLLIQVFDLVGLKNLLQWKILVMPLVDSHPVDCGLPADLSICHSPIRHS